MDGRCSSMSSSGGLAVGPGCPAAGCLRPPHPAYKSDAAVTSSMKRASGRNPPVWYLAVLVAVVAVVAGGQVAHAVSGIVVVGGAQVIADGPGLGGLMDVAAFGTFDGHSYLLALSYDRINIINVTDPLNPVRVGGIVHDRFVDRWLTDMKVFYPPDGRVYAAVARGGFLILDVTDPVEPVVIIDGAPGDAGSSHLAFSDIWDMTVYERPDGRIHALVDGNALRTIDITDPYNPVILWEGPDIPLHTTVDGNTAFLEPADGRIYIMYGGLRDGVFIADVTDPARHVLVSVIRHHDGDHPQGHEDPFRTYGIPAPWPPMF